VRRGGGLAAGGVQRLLQFRHQLVQLRLVLPHAGQARGLVAVAGVGLSDQLLLLGATGLERGGLALARTARGGQRLTLAVDTLCQRRQLGQVSGQPLDPACAVLLQVAGIGQRAGAAGGVLGAEQQAQVRIVAQGVGGAQQVGERRALAGEAGFQLLAASF